MDNKNLFTELRFKKSNEVHDSGYACIEIVGFNKVTEEERLLTKYSDVIHLPQMYIDDRLKMLGMLSIDISPESDYFRMFVTSNNFRIKVDDFIGSDFMFEVVKIK